MASMDARFGVRPYTPGDRAAIRETNRQALRMAQPGAFEQLLDTLDDMRAWVAVGPGARVVGHIVYTPVLAGAAGGEIAGMGLGELAVLPEFQRQGIGTLLGRTSLDALRAAHCPFVIVVGHASYYPRFGFRPGAEHGLRCQWARVPAESFMALVLDAQAMRGVGGVARFRDVA